MTFRPIETTFRVGKGTRQDRIGKGRIGQEQPAHKAEVKAKVKAKAKAKVRVKAKAKTMNYLRMFFDIL